jgi:hypothetical protein
MPQLGLEYKSISVIRTGDGSIGVERLESRPYKRSEMILHCLNYDVF